MRKTCVRTLPVVLLAALCAGVAACNHEPENQQRYYELKGTVISVDKGHQQAVIDHGAIPGFMEAMTMGYTVKDDAALEQMKPGDHITARVVVTAHNMWLDNVVIVQKSGQAPARPTVETHIPKPGDQVPDFTMLNQSGEKVRFRRLRGKIVVLTFIYTRCPFPDYCPRLTGNFAEINRALAENVALKGRAILLSLSFDPEHDTPKTLRDYAARYTGKDDPGFDRWEFAAIPSGELKDVALFFGLSYWTQGGQIIHSMSTALVGPDQKLFRWYPGNDWTPEQILKDMEALARSGDQQST
ncbi:MAG: SCO family protein [Deltaproteobacteria bacterium]